MSGLEVIAILLIACPCSYAFGRYDSGSDTDHGERTTGRIMFALVMIGVVLSAVAITLRFTRDDVGEHKEEVQQEAPHLPPMRGAGGVHGEAVPGDKVHQVPDDVRPAPGQDDGGGRQGL